MATQIETSLLKFYEIMPRSTQCFNSTKQVVVLCNRGHQQMKELFKRTPTINSRFSDKYNFQLLVQFHTTSKFMEGILIQVLSANHDSSCVMFCR